MGENKQIREDVLKSVNGLSDKQLNKRVEDGSWTIMQVLDHLYLMERTIVHALTDQLANGKNKSVDEKPIQLTTNRSTKVDAPSFVKPSEDFITLEEMKNKLSESRSALTNIVNSTDRALLEQRSYPHPMFGELSLKQWIPFVGLHEKRHLAQIEELKENLG